MHADGLVSCRLLRKRWSLLGIADTLHEVGNGRANFFGNLVVRAVWGIDFHARMHARNSSSSSTKREGGEGKKAKKTQQSTQGTNHKHRIFIRKETPMMNTLRG